ncbi:histone H1A-like [Pempheris klunzingeri]|uniref:histone H1A-like n=1 Tax=Pempheris klunzingeri TaxID=3127111 RepID=UPI003980AA61
MGPMVLLRVLQGLRDDELMEFQWYLKMPDALDDYQPINECQLLRAQRWDTVDLMVKAYTLDGALKVTKKVLEKINRNDLVQKLPGTSSGPAADSTEVEMRDEAPAATTSRNLQAPLSRQEAPTLEEQIIAAVAESKERKGLSQPALKKVLATKGVDVAKSNKHINIVILKHMRDGTLTQSKGIGASGSFKLPKKEPKAAKKDPAIVKKPAAMEAAKKATAEMMLAAKMAAEAVKAAAAAKKAAAEKASVAKVAVAVGKVAAAEKAAEKAAEAKEAAAKKAAVAKTAAMAANKAIAEMAAVAKKAEAAEKVAATKKAAAEKAAEKAAAAERVAATKKAAAEKAAAAAGRRLSLPSTPSMSLFADNFKLPHLHTAVPEQGFYTDD